VTLYLDTSNLVKMYVAESDSDTIANLVKQADIVVTSVLAYPEARATFARRKRERLLTTAELTAIVRQFDLDWPRFVAVLFGNDLALAAGRLADRLSIRGADAVHLASFEQLLGRSDDEDIRFSSADERLNRAARSLG
jgi:predicted nucleic acid-binding protein